MIAELPSFFFLMEKVDFFPNYVSSPLIVLSSLASFHDAKQPATEWKSHSELFGILQERKRRLDRIQQ